MRIKNPELEIDPSNPFKVDQLGRLESAEALTELVASLDGPFVLCIDSTWGTGKTTFVKMWEQHLKNQGFHCLYFNAWENDFYYDPLIPFIGEIQSKIVSALGEKHTEAREYFEKAKRIGGSLVRRAIPVALRIATGGVLDLDEVTEEALADFVAEFAQERIDSYEADKKTLEEFKENLEEFVTELSKDDSTRPLVFFVDELDRCRPTYAVELLERIKHLFNVPGIVFVLVLDKEQIAHSTKALYGTGMDVDGYLRRFIDLNYRLPEASREDFCKHLFRQFGFAEFFKERRSGQAESGELLMMFVEMAQMFWFSLRVQEQCFTQFSIALRTTPENYRLFALFLAFLIALKAANHDLYDRFVKGEASPQDVIDFIESQPRGTGFLNDDIGMVAEAYVASAHYGGHEMNTPIAEYTKKMESDDITKEQQHRYQRIIELLNQFRTPENSRILSYLAKKIDISEHFSSNAPR